MLVTKKRCFISVFLVLSLFIFASVHAENDNAFFWKVTPGQCSAKQEPYSQTVVYLMGSIHFADSSFYPIRAEIEQAFSRADTLVVELNINKIDSSTYRQLMAQKGSYKNGETIKEFISEQTWQQLRQRLQQLNIPYDAVKHYKPGVLVLTLMASQVVQMGFLPELGIDVHFLNKASLPGQLKNIVELETLEQQLNVFLNIPDADLLLQESLRSMDEAEWQMADIVRYWKTGDEDKMNKLLFEDALIEFPTFSAIYDSLIYQRNQQMLVKIENMLQQPGNYFVVVGSGHLIGDKGIVSALKQQGYSVERH